MNELFINFVISDKLNQFYTDSITDIRSSLNTARYNFPITENRKPKKLHITFS